MEKLLRVVCPYWQLSIIGSGPEEARLQRQIMTLNLQSSVEILPPTVAIMEEYMQSSVFVMTSRYEDMAMVLIEAMACGLPVVAYACKCGPKDVIQDQVDGFLIEEGEQQDFAEKLILLMKDDAGGGDLFGFVPIGIYPGGELAFKGFHALEKPEFEGVFVGDTHCECDLQIEIS